MALKKEITIDNITCSYWRIVGFNVSITGKIIQIFLVGYKDEEGRLRRENLVSMNYTIKPNEYTNAFNSIELLTSFYNYLKNNVDRFDNSEDI